MPVLDRLFHRHKPQPDISIITPPGVTRGHLVGLLLESGNWQLTSDGNPNSSYWQFESVVTGHRMTLVGPLDEPLSDSAFENLYEQLYEGTWGQSREGSRRDDY